MAEKQGKVESIDYVTWKIKLEKESQDYLIGKKVRDKISKIDKVKEGDMIKYEIKGPNFSYLSKIEKQARKQSSNNINHNVNNKGIKKNNSNTSNYDFVPLGEKILEKGKIKIGSRSGFLKCMLINNTRMSVTKNKEKYIITGSTLKGEIRNIIDVLTNSTVKNLKPNESENKEKFNYKKEKDDKKRKKMEMIGKYERDPLSFIPLQFVPTNQEENFSFSERLFGTTGDSKIIEKDNQVNNYKGRIYFTDAIPEKEIIVTKNVELVLMEPEPKFDEDYKYVRGRKFYKHIGSEIIKSGNNEKVKSKVDLAKENSKFLFDIYFENLTDDELGILLYALMLDGLNMNHRIGRGKALGFGSAKIKIKEFLLENKKEKYKNFKIDKLYLLESKQTFIKKAEEKYKLNERNEVQKLKEILKGT